jgi:hypothetical protein
MQMHTPCYEDSRGRRRIGCTAAYILFGDTALGCCFRGYGIYLLRYRSGEITAWVMGFVYLLMRVSQRLFNDY